MAEIWSYFDLMSVFRVVIFKSDKPTSRQSQLFDCLLIGQFVVFKQALEHSV